MISAVDGHVSSPRTRHRKKKGSKEITYSVPQDGRRPGSAAAAAGSATEGSWNYYQRERERERERKGREGERERRGGERGGEREGRERAKGERDRGSSVFFPHLPCAVSSSFRRLLHPGDSQESLFLIVSPFSFLPSPFSSHSPNVPLPPAGRNIKHHGDNPVFIRAPFSPVRGMGGRETAAVLNSSAPNE